MTSSTTQDATQFKIALQDYARVELVGDLKIYKMAIAFDLFRALVLATPVGNPDLWKGAPKKKGYVGGTARASWFVSDSIPQPVPVVKNTPSGGAINAQGESDLARLKEAKNIWVANNLPYIERIMEDGWSTQAPPGTFTTVIRRIRNRWGLS